MNEATSDSFDQVPLPARQQLGYYNDKVDKDARSGNGLQDRLELEDSDRRDYQVLPAEDGGSRVHEVTYHLESTPPPAEPEGAPGSESYNRARGVEGRALSTEGNATTARQSEEGYVTTQREAPGRNERMGAALGIDDHASAEAGSGKAAQVRTSDSVDDDAVPSGTVSQVLNWVGDDPDKARKAEAKENERDNPRQTLLDKLADIK
jgi:hypothetical protein